MTSGAILAFSLLAATSVLTLGAAGMGGDWGDYWSMMDGDHAGHMADHDGHVDDHECDAISAEECEAGAEAHNAHKAEEGHCQG